MAQSLIKNYLHITFSTKDRYPFIDAQIREELFCYLGGICRNLECNPVIIGGYHDHVHVLCLLSRKIALMKLIKELKTHTSKWIKTKGDRYNKFYWQKGYGGFSINPLETNIVKEYILKQEEHHKKITFMEEFQTFLKTYQIEFDERYIWD